MSWQGQPAERQISRRRRRWAMDSSAAMPASVAAVQPHATRCSARLDADLARPCHHEGMNTSTATSTLARPRGVERLIVGQATSDGAGVKLTRVLTQNLQRRLDPFLMLDAFGTDNPGDYIGGFPDHPHRGFETVTYMLEGRMRHRDSAGHEGLLSGGGVQWMTAGRGVIHSEMPEQEAGRMEGFQLWLNLPAKDKMCAPWYRDIPAGEIPVLRTPEGRDRAHHRRRQPWRGWCDAARGHRAAVPGPGSARRRRVRAAAAGRPQRLRLRLPRRAARRRPGGAAAAHGDPGQHGGQRRRAPASWTRKARAPSSSPGSR